jgi:hypothetical protein
MHHLVQLPFIPIYHSIDLQLDAGQVFITPTLESERIKLMASGAMYLLQSENDVTLSNLILHQAIFADAVGIKGLHFSEKAG